MNDELLTHPDRLYPTGGGHHRSASMMPQCAMMPSGGSGHVGDMKSLIFVENLVNFSHRDDKIMTLSRARPWSLVASKKRRKAKSVYMPWLTGEASRKPRGSGILSGVSRTARAWPSHANVKEVAALPAPAWYVSGPGIQQ
eukprot:s342_g15.t1